jgi:NADH-quinone oxidoreductase subunit N
MGSFLSIILVAITDIFAILILFESLAFILISLSILNFTRASIEFNIKYFIQNTVITGLSVFGIFGIYFIYKTTNFFILNSFLNFLSLNQNSNKILINFSIIIFFIRLTSFFYKLGVFPAHFYLPDLYESAPMVSILFISSVIKPVIFFILTKFYLIYLIDFNDFFKYLFTLIGFLSMLLGNISALGTSKIKRFLGYTSVGQFGFLFINLSTKNIDIISFSFIYLFLYNLFFLILILVLIEISAFSSVLNVVNFSDIGFLFKDNFFIKTIVTFSLLSISGLPPLILFLYKYLIFLNFFINKYYIIAICVIILNVISIIYYLRLLSDI